MEYIIIFFIFAFIVIISLLLWDRRVIENHGKEIPDGFKRSDEVNIDPVSGKKYRVYYNEETGKRFYHEED